MYIHTYIVPGLDVWFLIKSPIDIKSSSKGLQGSFTETPLLKGSLSSKQSLWHHF